MLSFTTTPWTNGSQNHHTGSGFGLRIPKEILREEFKKSWDKIVLSMDGAEYDVPITPGFWKKCNEIGSAHIGQWLIRHGLDKWRPRLLPRIAVKHLGGNKFEISKATSCSGS